MKSERRCLTRYAIDKYKKHLKVLTCPEVALNNLLRDPEKKVSKLAVFGTSIE